MIQDLTPAVFRSQVLLYIEKNAVGRQMRFTVSIRAIHILYICAVLTNEQGRYYNIRYALFNGKMRLCGLMSDTVILLTAAGRDWPRSASEGAPEVPVLSEQDRKQ